MTVEQLIKFEDIQKVFDLLYIIQVSQEQGQMRWRYLCMIVLKWGL